MSYKPNGSGRALILAPFQITLLYSLDKIADILRSIGYSVEIYKNGEANLDKFRGSFLNNYDVVFIVTHSGRSVSLNGTFSEYLVTGELYT